MPGATRYAPGVPGTPRRRPPPAGRPIAAGGRVGEPPHPCDERSTTPSRRTLAPATARDGSCGWPLPNREDTAACGPGRVSEPVRSPHCHGVTDVHVVLERGDTRGL